MLPRPSGPTALLIRAAGTNCDAELALAFSLAGARVEVAHIDSLGRDPAPLDAAAIIAIPGGFSYGDDIAAGRVFAATLRQRLWPALRAAIDRGALIIGVCNGFQVLTQLGLLPGCEPHAWPPPSAAAPAPTVALAENLQGRFIDRWCRMVVDASSPCVWTAGLEAELPEHFMLPVAHGEGRVIGDADHLARLVAGGQAPLRYAAEDNPNGSACHIAGLCDPTGRIFGLMPHPERYLSWHHHPAATRLRHPDHPTPGLAIFRNAVLAAHEAIGSA